MLQDNVFMNPLINTFMNAGAGQASRYAVERRRRREKQLQRYLSYLKALVKLKGVNIKPRDLVKVVNGVDRSMLTKFGLLLHTFEMLELAVRWNTGNPKRYTLKPKWLWLNWAEICDFRCVAGDASCPLFGKCPYHRVLQLLAEKEQEEVAEQ